MPDHCTTMPPNTGAKAELEKNTKATQHYGKIKPVLISQPSLA